jgi:hypothetical protein
MIRETFESNALLVVFREPWDLALRYGKLKSLKLCPSIWHRHGSNVDASRRRIFRFLRRAKVSLYCLAMSAIFFT